VSSLILKRASASRPSGEWNDDDFDVLADGSVVTRTMKVASRFALVTYLGLCVGGCDLFQDSNSRPWHAYAWKKSEGRFEWWFTNFESHRDCIEATRHAATTPPQNEWYSEPVGADTLETTIGGCES
jgi:hypothetical protein